MELKTCLGNKYSNSKCAHSVRKVLVGVDICNEVLVWCACRQLSWGRSFEQSSSQWLGTSPAMGRGGSHGGSGVGQWGGEASFQEHTSLQRENDNPD